MNTQKQINKCAEVMGLAKDVGKVIQDGESYKKAEFWVNKHGHKRYTVKQVWDDLYKPYNPLENPAQALELLFEMKNFGVQKASSVFPDWDTFNGVRVDVTKVQFDGLENFCHAVVEAVLRAKGLWEDENLR